MTGKFIKYPPSLLLLAAYIFIHAAYSRGFIDGIKLYFDTIFNVQGKIAFFYLYFAREFGISLSRTGPCSIAMHRRLMQPNICPECQICPLGALDFRSALRCEAE